MTVIRPNSISGITSITAKEGALNFYDSVGSNLPVTAGAITVDNINATGVSTFSNAVITGGSISGVSTIGVTTVTATNLTVNGSAYPSAGPLSNRNLIINGAMDINQRGWGAAAGASVSDSYITDRFVIQQVHDGVVSAGQTSMNSTVGGDAFTDGFKNALYFTVATADATLAAGQFQVIQQRIEGQNLQAIKKGTTNALPVTLSFWVRSTTTGTYIAELYDNDNTRQVSQAYTINAANTWEKKVLTFPADTVGTFDNDNALSLYVMWWLAAGSTFSGGTLNTSWTAVTTANRAVGQTNLLGTVNNNFFLTGVQLEVGSVATPFERRSYGQELALCQRYFWYAGSNYLFFWTGRPTYGPTWKTQTITFPVEMRTNPTVIEQTLSNTSPTTTGWDAGYYPANGNGYAFSWGGGNWAQWFTPNGAQLSFQSVSANSATGAAAPNGTQATGEELMIRNISFIAEL